MKFAMIYKYLFYFPAYIHKKCDSLMGVDPYIASYFLVGFTIAVNIFVVFDIVGILFVQSVAVYGIVCKSMLIIGFVMIALSYLYFKHNDRRDKIYDEIHQSPKCKKTRYGIYTLIYLVFSYGLWFVCSDIVCVLRNGSGLSYAENIVDVLNLTYW